MGSPRSRRVTATTALDNADIDWVLAATDSGWVIAIGLFALVAVNSAGVNGLFYGNPGQLGIKSFAIVVVAGLSFLGS